MNSLYAESSSKRNIWNSFTNSENSLYIQHLSDVFKVDIAQNVAA